MRFTLRPLVAGLIVLGAAGQALAQAPAQAPTPGQATDRPEATAQTSRLDLTPFVAMGDDLAPGGGAALTFALSPRFSLEAEASLGTDAGRSSLSVLYHLPQFGPVGVYAAGGAGFQRDEIAGVVPPDMRGARKTEFAVNIGAGVTAPLTERWAWRADFRWYNPKAEWPESWRAYYGLTVNLRH